MEFKLAVCVIALLIYTSSVVAENSYYLELQQLSENNKIRNPITSSSEVSGYDLKYGTECFRN